MNEIPQELKQGIRVFMLVSRNKDNQKNKTIKKVISRSIDDFDIKFKELSKIFEDGQRIYCNINERDISKGMMNFKIKQLQTDFGDNISRNNFYLDIRNRFISSLMKRNAKKTSYFLFDIDNGLDTFTEKLLKQCTDIIFQYKTKSGSHIITEPFNYTKLKLPDYVEFNSDGLMLLKS
jgi:hypothetical protein